MAAHKQFSEPDPTKLSLAEIVAFIDQLFVAEKYQIYRQLRRDLALKAYREMKQKQWERVQVQKAEARPRQKHSRKAA